MSWRDLFRSPAVKEAMESSKDRLDTVREQVGELRSSGNRLKENIDQNHVVANIMASFGMGG